MNFKQWLLLSEKITHNGETYATVMDLIHKLADKPNTYLSFQKTPQLEIWPGQHKKYDTPVGIYAYPIKYASEKMENLPFATENPYIVIFKPTGNIIHDNLTTQQQDQYLDKLKQMYPNLNLDQLKNFQIRSSYSKLWLSVVQIIAPNNPSLQNKIFRKLGIDGFDDSTGTGAIHSSEPVQAVFFRPQTLQKIQILDNVLHISLVGKQPLQKYPKSFLKDTNLLKLLLNATNKDEMAKKIIKNNKDLSAGDVTVLLLNVTNTKEIADLLGQNNIDKLNDDNINWLLLNATNKDEIAKIIIQNKKDLTDDNVYYLLDYATNKYEMANLLGSENIKKLTDNNVYRLLRTATNKDEMAKLLGSENINKLSGDNINGLLRTATNKDEIATLIIQNKKDLTDKNVYDLLDYATNKYEMATLIIQNKKDLSDDNFYDLLHSTTNKDEIAKLIIQNKKDLSDDNVYDLLFQATNPDEIAKLLGSENINKLSGDDVTNLLRFAKNKDEMRSTLQKYGRIS